MNEQYLLMHKSKQILKQDIKWVICVNNDQKILKIKIKLKKITLLMIIKNHIFIS